MRKDDAPAARKSKSAKVVFGIAFAVLAVYASSIIFAVGWTFINSFKTNTEFWDNTVSLPKKWLFGNYGEALTKLVYNRTTFVGMFVNSMWFAAGSAVLGALMHGITGYCFAKYKFRGKEAAFSFILFTITIPIVGSLPSFYRVVNIMRLNDSPLFLITALGGFGGNFLIMYAFFKSVDWAYAEAAQIDGAGHFYIFFKIMLPIAIGPVFALSILGFIGQWNNYETPILFLNKMPTLSSGLYSFYKESIHKSSQTVYYAGVLMSMAPVIILVALFGNRIMKNMTIGGIKG